MKLISLEKKDRTFVFEMNPGGIEIIGHTHYTIMSTIFIFLKEDMLTSKHKKSVYKERKFC
jgi:hypothetical protein